MCYLAWLQNAMMWQSAALASLSLTMQITGQELHVYHSAYALLVGSCCMSMQCKVALSIMPREMYSVAVKHMTCCAFRRKVFLLSSLVQPMHQCTQMPCQLGASAPWDPLLQLLGQLEISSGLLEAACLMWLSQTALLCQTGTSSGHT